MNKEKQESRVSRFAYFFALSILTICLVGNAMAAGTLSGTIVSESDGTTPVFPVTVGLYEPVTGRYAGFFVRNEPDGSFVITDIPPGEYWVHFNAYASATAYRDELYDDVPCIGLICDIGSSATFNVLEGDNQLDVQLLRGLMLRGNVTDANGTPLEDVIIETFDESGEQVCCEVDTFASGNWYMYLETGGTYYVRTKADSIPGLSSEVWNSTPCDDCDPTVLGTPIVVGESDISGIDFQLSSEGTNSRVSRPSIMMKSGFESITNTELQSFQINLPSNAMTGASLESSIGSFDLSNGPAEVEILSNFFTTIYLVDSAGEVVGEVYSAPSNEPIVIDAASTAFSILMTVFRDWRAISPDFEQMRETIEGLAEFGVLVSAVEKVMNSPAPGELLDDPNDEIYPAVVALLAAIEPLLSDSSAKNASKNNGVQALSESSISSFLPTPTLSVEGTSNPTSRFPPHVRATNNRMAPFGLSRVEYGTLDCEATTGLESAPYWVPGIDIYEDFFKETNEVVVDLKPLRKYLFCVSKAPFQQHEKGGPGWAPFPFGYVKRAMPGNPYEVALADARLKGEFAFFLTAIVETLGLGDPVTSTGRQLVGSLVMEAFNSGLIEESFNFPKYQAGATIPEIVLEFLNEMANNPSSRDRFISQIALQLNKNKRTLSRNLKNQAKKVLKIVSKTTPAGRLLEAAGYLGIYSSKILPDHEACYVVDSAGGLSDINPYPANDPTSGWSLHDKVCNPTEVRVIKQNTSGESLSSLQGQVRFKADWGWWSSDELDCGEGEDCTGTFRKNSPIRLEAADRSGWRFRKWADNSQVCRGQTTRTCMISSLQTNVVARAEFVKEFTLRAFAHDSKGNRVNYGLITSSPGGISCGTVCDATFPQFTEIQLSAQGTNGGRFVNWVYCPSAWKDPICDLGTEAADRTVGAIFEDFWITSHVVNSWSDLGTAIPNCGGVNGNANVTLFFSGTLESLDRIHSEGLKDLDGDGRPDDADYYSFSSGSTSRTFLDSGSNFVTIEIPYCWNNDTMDQYMAFSHSRNSTGARSSRYGVIPSPISSTFYQFTIKLERPYEP